MLFFKFKCCLLGICLYFVSCRSENRASMTVKLPVDSMVYIDVFDALSSQFVLQDSAKSEDIILNLDTLKAGIYSFVFSWERNVLRPSELKQYARYGELDLPRYSISKTVWIDPKECTNYSLSISKAITQPELEAHLLGNNSSNILVAKGKGQNFELFEDFVAIKRRYFAINAQQRDSLKKVQYNLNDNKLLNESKAVRKQLDVLWNPEIKESMIKAEIQFLKKHLNTKMFPYVYYSLIGTKDQFEEYKEIYDLLPPTLKPTFENYISKLN